VKETTESAGRRHLAGKCTAEPTEMKKRMKYGRKIKRREFSDRSSEAKEVDAGRRLKGQCTQE